MTGTPSEGLTNDRPDPRTGSGRSATIVTFYSYKGGAGRTMTVANVAWVLASAGRRVLVLDWDLESPGLHRYFRPFLTDKDLTSTPGVIDLLDMYKRAQYLGHGDVIDLEAHREYLRDNAQTLDWRGFPAGGGIGFLGAGLQRDGYDASVGSFPWDFFFENSGRDHIESMRKALGNAGYDYVLIDSRTGVADAAAICTQKLPDTVVLCFAMNNQSIEGCQGIARNILAGDDDNLAPPKVIPVPMNIEDGESTKRSRRRKYAQRCFQEVLTDLLAVDDPEQHARFLLGVEIPHKVEFTYEEVLASFVDEIGDERNLLWAYTKLARTITGDQTIEPASIPEVERRRILRQFESLTPFDVSSVVMYAAPQDRGWKEWIKGQLVSGNLDAVDLVPGQPVRPGESLVVVASPDLWKAPDQEVIRQEVLRRRPPGTADGAADHAVTVIRISNEDLVEPYNTLPFANLAVSDEQSARAALTEQFNLVPTRTGPNGDTTTGPRFPRRRPTVWDPAVPHPTSWFIGRVATLDDLRDRLMPGSANRAVVPLIGPSGTGKTEIAREYIQRFVADYDVIWWIPGETPDSARLSLRRLAAHLHPARDGGGLDDQGRLDDQSRLAARDAAAALEDLRAGRPSPRWLLVYDGAASPDELRDLLPAMTGPGHVIVTSTDPRWTDLVAPVRVGPFTPRECLEYLRHRLPDADRRILEDLGGALAYLPGDLSYAVGWISSRGEPVDLAVGAFLAELKRPESEVSTEGTVIPTVAFAALAESPEPIPRAGARLLELCAFLSPDGVATSLAGSPAMMRQLADHTGHAELADGGDHVPELLRAIERQALAEVDPEQGVIRLHQRLRDHVRGTMSAGERAASLAVVHAILASYAPPPDEVTSSDAARGAYAELSRHILPSDAPASVDGTVRLWLVNQLWVLWRTGSWDLGRRLGEECLRRWDASPEPADPLTLRMSAHLANVLRSLGRFREAYRLDEVTLARQRQHVGVRSRHTLLTAGGFGADNRMLGHYREALAEDQATWSDFRELMGEESEDTLNAANNLAISLELTGDMRGALERHRQIHDIRVRRNGATHPSTLWSECRVGICQRELGDYHDARVRLTSVAQSLSRTDGPSSHYTLRARKHQAVALRLDGEQATARRLTEDTLNGFESFYGVADPGTVACRLSLAADLYALNDSVAAVVQAEACLGAYERMYGAENPVTNACLSNLSGYLLGLREVARARELSERAYQTFLATLYEPHPYTVAAAVAFANALAADGEAARALEVDRAAFSEVEETAYVGHPYAQVVRDNLEDSTRVAGGAGSRHRRHIDIDITSM